MFVFSRGGGAEGLLCTFSQILYTVIFSNKANQSAVFIA